MPSTPSFYLANLERKRGRSRDLREGLNSAVAGGMQGLDTFGKLQRELAATGKADAATERRNTREDEATARGRATEDRNQARADKRFEWEGEDRERKETDRQKALADALADDGVRGDLSTERTIEQQYEEATAEDEAEMPLHERIKGGDMGDALAKLRGAIDGPDSVPLPASVDALTQSKIDANAALARLRDRSKVPGGGKGAKPKKEPTQKEIDDAKLRALRIAKEEAAAEAKANPAPKEPDAATRKEIRGIEDLAGTVDQAIEQVTKTGTGLDVTAKSIGGRLPLVGDAIDPGAENRTTDMMLGSIAAAAKKAISGGAISEPERKALEKFLATVGSTTTTSLAALNILKGDLARARAIRMPAQPAPVAGADPQKAFLEKSVRTTNAAARYRAAAPEQQAAIKAIIADGTSREDAVDRVLGGQ